jgi:hypothetical protein
MLTDTGDAAAMVAGELNCFDCRGWALSLTMTADLTILVTGSHDNAIKHVQDGLLSDLDAQ